VSGETLKKLIGDATLDDALEKFGFDDVLIVLRIEFNEGGVPFDFSGWSFVADGPSRFALVHDLP
jgi:hypothetical protein